MAVHFTQNREGVTFHHETLVGFRRGVRKRLLRAGVGGEQVRVFGHARVFMYAHAGIGGAGLTLLLPHYKLPFHLRPIRFILSFLTGRSPYRAGHPAPDAERGVLRRRCPVKLATGGAVVEAHATPPSLCF